ncbi:MAG: NusG domain II-containing protein [Ruminococcaceae bacterium]|nr:NusG domain II-containing protein [Oscillospiraceae bacterium]
MVKKADIFLLIFFLLSALLIFSLFFFSPKSSGETLVINIDNREYMRLPLNEDTTVNLPENTVVIKDGKAFVESSLCPDKVCINQGKINRKGETVICLPARVVLEVE